MACHANQKKGSNRGIVIDKSGKIYVGSSDEIGYLTTTKQGSTSFHDLTHLHKDTTTALGIIRSAKRTSNFLYFQSYENIIQYSPTTQAITVFKADTNGKFMGDFVFEDTYYTRLEKQGLLKIEQNQLKHAYQANFFKNGYDFKTAVPYNKTSILIPTRTEGLFLYNPLRDTTVQQYQIPTTDFFNNNELSDLLAFRDNYFIVSSVNKGAVLLDNQQTILQTYTENSLLATNNIYYSAIDTTQNLWLGLANGLAKTDPSLALTYWDKNSGLKNAAYRVIRHKGTIYIGSMTKAYFIDKTNRIQEVENSPIGQNWYFFEPQQDSSLLLGTIHGIYEIKGNKAVEIYKGGNAYKIEASTKNPNRIFSTDENSFISLKYERGKWISEGTWQGIKDNIRGIIEDEQGDIWLGTFRNGVIRITPRYDSITKPKKIRYYTKKDGFTSLKNILPFRYKNKIIWATETGLVQYNSKTDKFEPFCELGEQFCNGSRGVYRFVEMPDGKIWISPLENKKADIGYLQPNKKGGYDWIFAPFRRIPHMFINTFYLESSGVVWIGGSEGLYKYVMHKDTKNYNQPFTCLIRKVTTGRGDSLLYGGNATVFKNLAINEHLSYTENDLKIEFAAPFFDQEERTLYSYQLEGFDENWSEWSRQTSKEYTNLYEGTYIFKVKAKNIYEVESSIEHYKITILPPIHRTWWAYLLYVLLASIGIFGIVKLNTRRLVKQKQHLEELVKQRTVEIEKQKDEIQGKNVELYQQKEEILTQNEELHQQQEEITAQRDFIAHTNKELAHQYSQIHKSVEAAKLIQEAILPFEDRVRTFLPHYFVFYRPKDVVSGDFYWIEQVQEKIFIAVVDCTGHGVPGAFMSMIGNTLLDHIVKVQHVFSPEKVLKALNEEVHSSLKQKDTDNNNGMDVAFVCIEKREDDFLLSFAGAKRPLYYISSATNELSICKGSKVSIGGRHSFNKEFTKNEIELPYNSTFYLFSDGYADQCNTQRDSYGSLRLGQLLTEVAMLPIELQETTLAKVFDDYKRSADQRDDILVVGVKIEK